VVRHRLVRDIIRAFEQYHARANGMGEDGVGESLDPEAVGQNEAGGAAAPGGAPPRETGSDPASRGARASSGSPAADPPPGPVPTAERGPSL